MKNQKSFDCVEMKNRIQEDLLTECEGLTPEEERQKRIQKLSSSDSPAAKIWQSACKRSVVLSK
ncbi:MAG TPA: hypothetical protein PLI09_12245 [Candidatus Hydrogenedentes bacterium]|nr:hypothetical protein [Candidatus Hydrogenedentota bacterium]